MKRIHNSKEIIKEIFEYTQHHHAHFKPNGLWYGIDFSCHEWMKREMPDWVKPYDYVLEVDLSKILVISNKDQLLEFVKRYGYQKNPDLRYKEINWCKVSEEYSGIEINPYRKSYTMDGNIDLLMSLLWYDAWDVEEDVFGIRTQLNRFN